MDEIVLASFECHLQSACQQDRDTIPEELGSKGRHNRWDTDVCHQHAVDIAYQSASGKGQHESNPGSIGWIESLPGPGEGKARQRNDGGETQIDLACGNYKRQ